MKVLIVDDNRYDRETIAFLLKNNGFDNIFMSTNGKECLEMAIAERPDVVILDVILPDMKGYGICRALKTNQDLNCKVILLTGEFVDNNPAFARKAEPDFFLAKTQSHDSILKILKSLQ